MEEKLCASCKNSFKELQLEGVSPAADETAGQANMGLKMHISH